MGVRSRAARRRTCRAWLVVSSIVVLGIVLRPAAPAGAQTPTAPSAQGEGARSIAAAFRALADVAAAASDDAGWQQADDAYNDVVLAAIDLHRPALLQAGDAAQAPLATVDAALFQIGLALDAQDAGRIRAEAERVATALDALAPGLAGGAPALEAALTSWRDLAAAYQRLADRQRGGEDVWRDLRNAAIALIDDVEARTPTVRAAVPGQALSLDLIRVLAFRMRMAALEQSAEGAATALRLFDRALGDLRTAVSTAGVPPIEAPAILSFEGQPVVGQIGQSVALPIVTHGVADVGGLGGFVLDVRWSPRALRMDDVRWNLGGAASATANDVAAGHYVLELPPAPVGPEGDAQVVELVMTVLGVTPDAADYVPSDTLEALIQALDDAALRTRSGEVAVASAHLFVAYATFADGQGTQGSLYARLDEVDQAAVVDAAWLTLLDRSSRPEPAGADAVIEAIGAARAALLTAVDAYMASLSTDGGIPVTIDVISATDLAGRPLSTRASVAARVLTTGLVTPTAFSATDAVGANVASTSTLLPSGAAPMDVSTVDGSPPGTEPSPSAVPPDAAESGDGRSDARLRVALVAALVVGGLAALATSRRGDPTVVR